MTKNELSIKSNYDPSTVSSMVSMSKVLKNHIATQGLSTNILGKQYVNIEGWCFAGGLMGMSARITNVENISSGTEKKWRADAEIFRIKDNIVIGNGTAICSNLETKKKTFDEYAVCSMSQTRAISKAYRNMIGWVIKLSGYDGTPSEEMVKMGQETAPKQPVGTTRPVNTPSAAQNANSDQILLKLKDKLMKLGAKNEQMALKILENKTGLVWKGFSNHGPVAVKEAYSKLLNSK